MTPKVRHPIRRQFFLLFLSLTALILILTLFANNFFLERFYIRNKERTMSRAHAEMLEAVSGGKAYGEEFNEMLLSIAEEDGIMTIVLDADANTVAISAANAEFLSRRLWDKLLYSPEFLTERTAGALRIERGEDEVTGAEYMEGFGYLDESHVFLMRTPIAGIHESAAISNRFMAYIGLLTMLLAGAVAFLLSGRATKPIRELTELSTRMRDLDFEARYTPHTGNELDLLGANMNELSETLKETITELKQANAELTQDIARKEEIDVMRREFISNVSHELKTPIALIRGYAEGLLEGVSDDEESRNYYCGVIVDEASRMNRMVQQLMKLNQLESGTDVPTIERFDIIDLIQNYLRSADILMKEHNASLRMEDYPPVYVWADSFLAEEVLQNYISNALQHLDGERVIEISVKEEDGKARVSVFNTGEPVPEESLPHIWEKFYKADKARTRAYGGSGIGLSIVKAIQDSMGLSYGAKNYDNGVAFWFELDTVKKA